MEREIDRGYIGDEGVSYELYLDIIGLNFCGICVHFRTLCEENLERKDERREVSELSKNLTEAVRFVFNYAGSVRKDTLVWYSEPGGEECRFYRYEESWW